MTERKLTWRRTRAARGRDRWLVFTAVGLGIIAATWVCLMTTAAIELLAHPAYG